MALGVLAWCCYVTDLHAYGFSVREGRYLCQMLYSSMFLTAIPFFSENVKRSPSHLCKKPEDILLFTAAGKGTLQWRVPCDFTQVTSLSYPQPPITTQQMAETAPERCFSSWDYVGWSQWDVKFRERTFSVTVTMYHVQCRTSNHREASGFGFGVGAWAKALKTP